MLAFVSLFLFSLGACTSDASSSGQDSSNSVQESEAPDITIQARNLPAGNVVLVGIFADQFYKQDSTVFDGTNAFKFKRDKAYPSGLYFVFFSNEQRFTVLLDNDQTMNISVDGQDINGSLQIEGNLDSRLLAENNRFEDQYNQRLAPVNSQLQQLSKTDPQYNAVIAQRDHIMQERKQELNKIMDAHPNSFFTAFKKAGQNPDIVDVRNPDGTVNVPLQTALYRKAFWDDVDFSNEKLLHTPVIKNKLERYIKNLTVQHSDSIVASATALTDKVVDYPEYLKYFANYITLAYQPTKSTLMDSEKVYVNMIQRYFTKDLAFWSDSMEIYALRQRADEMAASLTGLKAPDVVSTGPDGKQYSLYDSKSDYVVVYLYNPTCEHCMEQTPVLRDMYQRKSRKEFDVFAIAIDTNDEEWKEYIRKNNLNWTNVYDPSNRSIYKKYYVDITPEVYVLNKERIIIGKNLNANQIEGVIQQDKER